MCLAVPGLVESIEGDYAQVDFGGVHKRVCITLLPNLHVGEYVIVHTGYAIESLKPEEAQEDYCALRRHGSGCRQMMSIENSIRGLQLSPAGIH